MQPSTIRSQNSPPASVTGTVSALRHTRRYADRGDALSVTARPSASSHLVMSSLANDAVSGGSARTYSAPRCRIHACSRNRECRAPEPAAAAKRHYAQVEHDPGEPERLPVRRVPHPDVHCPRRGPRDPDRRGPERQSTVEVTTPGGSRAEPHHARAVASMPAATVQMVAAAYGEW